MRYLYLGIILLASFGWASGQSFEEKVTSAGNIGMTINNLGMIGNSFSGSFSIEGFPSCEYPVNSGIEHLFDGGLWVGGLINGNTVAVTSGAIDASRGYSSGLSGFEFSAPVGSGLNERSSLFDSPFYSVDAISHQDFVCDFADSAIFVPGTSIQINEHDNPLDIGVHFETYNWNYSFANFFVILNFRITNVSNLTGDNHTIDDLYLGYWMDGVVRNINITPPGGSAFFNKGGNGYEEDQYMAYEYDGSGDLGFTESYIAMKFLGAEKPGQFLHPDIDTTIKGHFNSWQFNNSSDPVLFIPRNDLQKYGKMSQGLNTLPDWPNIKNQLKSPNNRSSLISVGSMGSLAPGEYIDVAFAVVCAKKNEDGLPNTDDNDIQRANLLQNASWAQTAYNGEDENFNGILDAGEDADGNGRITRYILPAPPEIPVMRIEPGDNKVDVYWTRNSELSVDPISKEQDFEGYRIYKTQVGFDVKDQVEIFESLNLAGEWDLPGNQNFYDTGLDEIMLAEPTVFEGDTNQYWYKYTFENVQNGWQHVIAVTAFDEGDEVNNLESLESSPLANMKFVFPGKVGNAGFENGDPFVYPNPYYANASWEGASTLEEDRKIMFANLPPRAEVRIYTVAGDLVDSFEHDENYTGEDIRWFDTYSDLENTEFPGGEHAWDLLSKDTQIIARGIYLFAVKDLDTGKIKKGKFVIIK